MGRPRSLAPQDRVRGSLRLRAPLVARDPANAARQARLLEDRLGELGPGAVAVGGDVVDAERQLEDLLDRGGEMADVCRRGSLVVDDGDLVALVSEAQHRANEVARGPPEEARAA